MYKLLEVNEANDGKHKYVAILFNKKTLRKNTIKFGSYKMMDYILWNEKEGKQYADGRKKLYIQRHGNMNENWEDVGTSGFWSRWLLWNKPTLRESLDYIIDKFKLS